MAERLVHPLAYGSPRQSASTSPLSQAAYLRSGPSLSRCRRGLRQRPPAASPERGQRVNKTTWFPKRDDPRCAQWAPPCRHSVCLGANQPILQLKDLPNWLLVLTTLGIQVSLACGRLTGGLATNIWAPFHIGAPTLALLVVAAAAFASFAAPW